MPQMSPILWLMLFYLTILNLFIMMMFIYFFSIFNSLNFKIKMSNKFLFNLNW